MTASLDVGMPPAAHTLMLGWGNPGRRDDGLGPALVAVVEARCLPGVRFDSDYQLQVEDAAEVARYERVIFVDADRSGSLPFSIRRVRPGPRALSFSTHSVCPEAVLALARGLFEAEPEAWLLGIHGYEFDGFGEGLSVGARANLAAAAEFIELALRTLDFHPIDPDGEDDPCQTPCP